MKDQGINNKNRNQKQFSRITTLGKTSLKWENSVSKYVGWTETGQQRGMRIDKEYILGKLFSTATTPKKQKKS